MNTLKKWGTIPPRRQLHRLAGKSHGANQQRRPLCGKTDLLGSALLSRRELRLSWQKAPGMADQQHHD